MLDQVQNILKYIESKGYEAYVVGGFVRDYIMGISSDDIDVCTNATPEQLSKIFNDIISNNDKYGSIVVKYNNVNFEITTFRVDCTYVKNRKPEKVIYVNSLSKDLKRRDFTINTICMNSSLEIIDHFNGISDINTGLIKTVGNAFEKFSEDALRMLRAVRFATVFNFKLDEYAKEAIISNKHLLSSVSFYRKKQELEKIFLSKNLNYGIDLIKELGLDYELGIYNIEKINKSNDILSIWASIDFSSEYPFSKKELEMINTIKYVSNFDNFDNNILYKYGLYPNVAAAKSKGIDEKEIIGKYNSLPIKSRSDILITSTDIKNIIEKEKKYNINDVYLDIENQILNGALKNNKKEIKKYIIYNYLGDKNERK